MKSRGGLGREVTSPPPSLLFFRAPFTSHRSPLSERLEQARKLSKMSVSIEGRKTTWHGQETGELSVRAPNTCIPSSLADSLAATEPFFHLKRCPKLGASFKTVGRQSITEKKKAVTAFSSGNGDFQPRISDLDGMQNLHES